MNELAFSEPRLFHARSLRDYNPFYLLSAMCMLFGLFSLNNSLTWSPLPQRNLLWIILILGIYECVLVGLGVFLARHNLMRDAGTLFVLEAFFLVDAGFLNAEIFNFSFQLGLVINSVLLLLAFLKLAAIFWSLRLPLDSRYAIIMAEILFLTAMPGVLKVVSDRAHAELSTQTMYGLWWIVGAIPILYLLVPGRDLRGRHDGIVWTFLLLPAVSIIAHLCTANWVYHIRWQSPNLAPLFLGLAAAIGASDRHVHNLAARMRLQLCLPILGLILASSSSTLLFFSFAGISVTPLRLTLLAAAAIYFHGTWVHRHPYFGAASLACLAAAGLGSSPEAITQNSVSIGDTSWRTVWRLVPRTRMQWGIVSIVCSYLLLVIGLLLSLARHARAIETPILESDSDTT